MHSGAPAVFAAELHEQRSRPRDLLSLRVEAVAGAPLPDALFRTVQEELWPTLLTAYSLTEASTMITLTTLEDSIARRMGTVGRPIGETSFCVLDPGGSELPPESLGEIGRPRTGGHVGLLRQPGETSESFTPSGHFCTGDIGIVDDDGCVHLVGRGGGVIIRCGSNVYPREIEDRLLARPVVQRSAGRGFRTSSWGKRSVPRSFPWRGRSSPKRSSGSGAGRVSPNTGSRTESSSSTTTP